MEKILYNVLIKMTALTGICCGLTEIMNAQSPFSYYYRDNFGSNNIFTYNINILSNQDILHTEGAVYSGNQIMRTNAAGVPVWHKALGNEPILNAVNESNGGNLLLTTSYQDSLTNITKPSFVLIDSIGNLIHSHYYQVDTADTYTLKATVTSTGRSAALFDRNYPARYGIISVDNQGLNPWCRIYQSPGAIGRYELMSGTNGSLLLAVSDQQDHLHVRKISASGTTLWENEYAVNGSIEDIELNSAVKLSDNVYALALVVKQQPFPYETVVLYIDEQGLVLSAHKYDDGMNLEPAGKIFRLDDTKAILAIGHFDSIPHYPKLAIINTSGAVIQALPSDTISFYDIKPLDSLNYYIKNGYQTFQLKNIYQPVRPCEVIASFNHLMATATAAPVTTTVQNYNTFASSYTPTLTDRIIFAYPACSALSLEENNGFESVKIFPNPSSLETIQVSGLSDGSWYYSISDMSGKMIYQEVLSNNTVINLKDVLPGIYILELQNESQFIRKKFIKQ